MSGAGAKKSKTTAKQGQNRGQTESFPQKFPRKKIRRMPEGIPHALLEDVAVPQKLYLKASRQSRRTATDTVCTDFLRLCNHLLF